MRRFLKFLSFLIVLSLLTACYLPSWTTYTNTTYQFQFQYPSAGTLVTDTPTAALIQLPFNSGYNLLEKYLDVAVTEDVYPCTSPYTAGWAPGSIVPVHMTIGGLDWVKESAGEGAVGSLYEWIAYSTANGDICVSLTFVLHSSNPSIYYPMPTPTYNSSTESSIFLLIVGTFTWLSGTPMPTLVVTDTPTPVSTFTPTPALPFFIPHLNAYCRHGPDPIFDSFALAMKGQSYPIVGRNFLGTWFLLRIMANVECWVPANTGEASGDVSGVRVMQDIPTPTFTPLPQINCGQYKDRASCGNVPACIWNENMKSCLNR